MSGTMHLRPRAPILQMLAGAACCISMHGQVTARLVEPAQASQHPHKAAHTQAPAAVVWLQPVTPGLQQSLAWRPQGSYRLLQKNKMFSPHLLVIPAGAIVSFPNGDPLFHNVFSLFDGKRFDLGLYEAGSSRDVRFEHAGISYIFCDIHPEMSAVVIALNTPLWAIATPDLEFHFTAVPAGTYEAHVWVEGEDHLALARWTHVVTVREHEPLELGEYRLKPANTPVHVDKFGHPYPKQPSDY